MSKPFMMLYVADYLADTRHLTAEQHGAYLLLLMSMWRCGGYIPGDERSLAKLACLSLKQWRRVGAPVEALLTRQGEKITQQRLLSELQKASVISDARRAAAHRSHEVRSLKTHDTPRANAESLHEQSTLQREGNHNHIHNQNKKEKKPPAVAEAAPAVVSAVVLPAWVSPEAWQGYCDMRRRKRAPLTERAKGLVLKELEQLMRQGHDPNAVLDQSTQNSWTDVYALKSKDGKHAKQSANNNFLYAAAAYIDEQFNLAADSGGASADNPTADRTLIALLPA
jgi:uncharacterized protein YdaU (DUF1376 family)